jgi:hypothetical protein
MNINGSCRKISCTFNDVKIIFPQTHRSLFQRKSIWLIHLALLTMEQMRQNSLHVPSYGMYLYYLKVYFESDSFRKYSNILKMVFQTITFWIFLKLSHVDHRI